MNVFTTVSNLYFVVLEFCFSSFCYVLYLYLCFTAIRFVPIFPYLSLLFSSSHFRSDDRSDDQSYSSSSTGNKGTDSSSTGNKGTDPNDPFQHFTSKVKRSVEFKFVVIPLDGDRKAIMTMMLLNQKGLLFLRLRY